MTYQKQLIDILKNRTNGINYSHIINILENEVTIKKFCGNTYTLAQKNKEKEISKGDLNSVIYLFEKWFVKRIIK